MYIGLNVCKQMTGIKLLLLHNNTGSYLTMCKQINLGSFKNVISQICLQIIFAWIGFGTTMFDIP